MDAKVERLVDGVEELVLIGSLHDELDSNLR
jgi:hypothetical protein